MKVYLDNAATTFPKPEEVYHATDQAFRHCCANPGRSGHQIAMAANRVVYETRCRIASFFNIPHSSSVVFTPNATAALNLGIKGPLKPGDHVVTTSMEHNSVLRPLVKMRDENKIELTIVQADQEGFVTSESIAAALRPETALVAVIHASNIVGSINPIRKIGAVCRQNNVLFLVDASQSAGLLAIDVKEDNIDLLAAPGHKSLYGPQGTGFLYIREDLTLDTTIEGGTGGNSDSLYQPDLLPDRFESGTLNTPGLAGLTAGLNYLTSRGRAELADLKKDLHQYLFDALGKLDEVVVYGSGKVDNSVPVVSINIKEMDGGEVATALDEYYNIMVRVGLHCAPLAHKSVGSFPEGSIRISLGIFNTKKEIDYLIGSLEKVILEG